MSWPAKATLIYSLLFQLCFFLSLQLKKKLAISTATATGAASAELSLFHFWSIPFSLSLSLYLSIWSPTAARESQPLFELLRPTQTRQWEQLSAHERAENSKFSAIESTAAPLSLSPSPSLAFALAGCCKWLLAHNSIVHLAS